MVFAAAAIGLLIMNNQMLADSDPDTWRSLDLVRRRLDDPRMPQGWVAVGTEFEGVRRARYRISAADHDDRKWFELPPWLGATIALFLDC